MELQKGYAVTIGEYSEAAPGLEECAPHYPEEG